MGPGADGFVTTNLNNCPGDGDDTFDTAAGIIRNGPNNTIDTAPNALDATTLALTAMFANAATGVILESDILFNDGADWEIHGGQAATPTQAEVRTVALHEIGHFFGLHHAPSGPDADNAPFGDFPGAGDMDADGDGVIDTPIMDSPTMTTLHTLSTGDIDGINFLYTPDLGDAPDPFTGFNRYPSLVHGTTPGRLLNGLELLAPAKGAEHLFGFFSRYQYEWLGAGIDDSELECEARVPDKDKFDDGVSFGGPFVPGGPPVRVTVTVATDMDVEGGAHAYGATTPMYINGWFDWDANGVWTEGEHLIGTGAGEWKALAAGPYPFLVAAPAGAKPGGYARFRLDYKEDVAQTTKVDDTLSLAEGAAQFGEVEDYPIPYPGFGCGETPNEIFFNLFGDGVSGPGDGYNPVEHYTLCSGCGPSNFQRSGCGFDFTPATATATAAAGQATAVADADYILCAIDLATTHFSGPNELDVYVSVGGKPDGIQEPGRQLEQIHVSGAMLSYPSSSLVTARSVTYPLLRAGTQSWLVAFPDSQTHAGWHLNSISDPGLNAFFYGSCSASSTTTCRSDSDCPSGETCQPQSTTPTIEQATASSPRGAFRVWGGACTSLARPVFTIGKLNTPLGDDTLTAQGSVTLPVPFDPQLDPLTNGVRVLLSGTKGMLINATIPGGAFDKPAKRGWKVNKAGTTWTYSDTSKTPAVDGIFKVVVKDKSAKTPGLVTLQAKGKAGSYAVAQSDLPLTGAVVLGPPVEQCASASFASCSFNASGSALKCK